MRSSRISYDLKDPRTHRRAVREIGDAVRVARGNVTHAADELEVSHRALARWIAEFPALRKHVDKVRKRFGFIHGIRNVDE